IITFKVEPILLYIPKSPLSGTPPIYMPEEKEKKEFKKEPPKITEREEAKEKKGEIPIIVKKGEKNVKIEGRKGDENSEGKGNKEEGGENQTEKESLKLPEMKSQESTRGYLYSEGIGKPKLNFPSGFYFKGGSGGTGGEGIQGFAGSVFFDSGGYDITPWAKEVIEKVKRNWFVPIAARYGIKGITGIYIVFERDGNLSTITISRKSQVISFDQAAYNAIISSMPFPKLPYDFPKENLPAYFFFYYNIPVEWR
ncbi:MAG: TonB C-terminal domain-containing protein, partial [Candidatus Aminicenantia bacterium]